MTVPVFCPHLRVFVEQLLAQGAQIVRIEDSWSEAVLAVVLDKGPCRALAEQESLRLGLSFWKNDDAHYSIEYGCFCEEHKHGISWPQSQSVIAKLD